MVEELELYNCMYKYLSSFEYILVKRNLINLSLCPCKVYLYYTKGIATVQLYDFSPILNFGNKNFCENDSKTLK